MLYGYFKKYLLSPYKNNSTTTITLILKVSQVFPCARLSPMYFTYALIYPHSFSMRQRLLWIPSFYSLGNQGAESLSDWPKEVHTANRW